MKMQSGIFQLICLSMGIMASIASAKGKDGIVLDSYNSMKTDTTIIKVDTFDLDIIAPSSGIQYYKDGIVFLSSSKLEGKIPSNHLSFGKIDARYAVLNNSTLENYQVFSSSSPFPYPCEAITFNSDYTIMYFTKYSKTDHSEKIYEAKLSSGSGDHGSWTIEQNPVSFCSDQSTYTHPALSADGETIVFASNRTGTVGGMDLFVCKNNGGTWSSPVNLGETINTKSNELYPFLDSENNLYFSSDGLQGSGGYDIFVCKFTGSTWEKPVNLSTPINTIYDDVAFTINRKDGKSAFYTIKKTSGRPSVQLLMITINNGLSQNNFSKLSQIFTSSSTPSVVTPEKIISVAKEPDAKLEISKQAPAKTAEPVIKQPVTAGLANPVSQVKPQEAKVEPEKKVTTETVATKDVIVYRVQIFSGGTGGSTKVKIDNKPYTTYEYSNNGGFPTCVGEFSTLAPAKDFQGICRKSGFPQAFVVAFKNNVRSADPALFK